MDDKIRLGVVADMIKELRRKYSKRLVDMVKDPSDDIYEIEDLTRLIGTLEASYNHALASIAGDGDIYCLVGKHLPYALVLAGEVGEPTEPIYTILSILTEGKIEACVDCRTDEELAELAEPTSEEFQSV